MTWRIASDRRVDVLAVLSATLFQFSLKSSAPTELLPFFCVISWRPMKTVATMPTELGFTASAGGLNAAALNWRAVFLRNHFANAQKHVKEAGISRVRCGNVPA